MTCIRLHDGMTFEKFGQYILCTVGAGVFFKAVTLLFVTFVVGREDLTVTPMPLLLPATLVGMAVGVWLSVLDHRSTKAVVPRD